jgi:heme A synthase
MQFYGFLPRMILGGMLGYLLVWSGSLWLPILGHFINNAGAVIFTYLFSHGLTTMDPDKVGAENDYMSVVVSVAVIAIIFAIIYRNESKNRLQEG